jgi:hypothetical protein
MGCSPAPIAVGEWPPLSILFELLRCGGGVLLEVDDYRYR